MYLVGQWKKWWNMKKLHKVVVVGRANVGKSTLFNRLSSHIKSLTLDYAGVTRDFVSDVVTWNGKTFELIDTGGIQLQKSDDFLTEKVRLLALDVLSKASVILFVCDGTIGVTAEDRIIAKHIHKMGRPTLLLINKSDCKDTQLHLLEFERLGFKDTLEISAQHGIATGTLLHDILKQLPEDLPESFEEPSLRVALLGKPNVGKSSLMNCLAQEERSLVTDIPGTTREALHHTLSFYQETIQLTDTAGVRRKRSVSETLEEMMVKSSLQAVRDAHVVLLLLDAHEGQLSSQELKLAAFVFETGKALILVRNKADLITEENTQQWKGDADFYDHLLKKLEVMTISCKTGYNVGKLLPLIKEVAQRYQVRFSASELTVLFKNALEKSPLVRNQQHLKIYSAKQVAHMPPTIRLNVNEPQWFETSQLGFLENVMRKTYDLKSIPISFIPRKMIF